MSEIAVRLAEDRTLRDQPIHVVCAGSDDDRTLRSAGGFVVTVPEPTARSS